MSGSNAVKTLITEAFQIEPGLTLPLMWSNKTDREQSRKKKKSIKLQPSVDIYTLFLAF